MAIPMRLFRFARNDARKGNNLFWLNPLWSEISDHLPLTKGEVFETQSPPTPSFTRGGIILFNFGFVDVFFAG